jgi:hypothetical protein
MRIGRVSTKSHISGFVLLASKSEDKDHTRIESVAEIIIVQNANGEENGQLSNGYLLLQRRMP